MTWIVIIKYKEELEAENVSFLLQKEAVHKIAELINFETQAINLQHNYDVTRHIESIKLENTVTHDIIPIQ